MYLMTNAPPMTVWGVVTDFLATNPSPQEILDYRLPDELETRAHELLERNQADELTPAERDEMFEFARVDDVMSLLKAKTLLKMREDKA